MAPILIVSLYASNQGVKTHNWNRCYAHFLASFCRKWLCKYDVALGHWLCNIAVILLEQAVTKKTNVYIKNFEVLIEHQLL